MIHGTAVAVDGLGILLTGPSGSGKSDLALRIIDRGGVLVSDDVVIVSKSKNGLSVGVAPNIAGKIEVRGVGICNLQHLSSAPLQLVVELSRDVKRMPDQDRSANIMGTDIPSIELASFEVSAAIKVGIALQQAVGRMSGLGSSYPSTLSESREI